MEKLVLVVGAFHITVELILLMAVDRLSGYSSPGFGKLLAASLTGLYSSLCLLPGGSFLAGGGVRWLLLGLLGGMLYSRGGKLLPRLALMLLLNLALDGFQRLANQKELLSFAAAGIAVAFICVVCFRDGASRRYLSLELVHGGKRAELTALVDSGNTLRDPISGEPVVVVSHRAAFTLTGLSRQQLLNPLDTMAHATIPGLRLVPYHSVGKENGMLLALRLKGCTVAGKEKDLLVAFAPSGLGKEGSFQALIGGQV